MSFTGKGGLLHTQEDWSVGSMLKKLGDGHVTAEKNALKFSSFKGKCGWLHPARMILGVVHPSSTGYAEAPVKGNEHDPDPVQLSWPSSHNLSGDSKFFNSDTNTK